MTKKNDPGWTIWLWTTQLVPSLALIVFAVFRIATKSQSDSVGLKPLLTFFILVIGASWTGAALSLLMTPHGRNWIVSRWRDWCLAGASILIAVVVLDIGLTLKGVVPTIEVTRSHSLSYTPGLHRVRLIPQNIATENSGEIHINRRGYRGPEVKTKRTPGKYRIVFLGGSQVFDYTGGGWPNLVGKELRNRGIDVEVINAGVPSHNTNDALHKLATDLWMLTPDIVFVCNTWNDAKHFSRMATGEPYRRLPPLEPMPHNVDWRLYPQGLDKMLSVSSFYRMIRIRLLSLLVTEEGTWRSFRLVDMAEKPTNWAALDSPGPRQFALNLRLILAITREIAAELMICRQARLSAGVGTSGMTVDEYVRRNTSLSLPEIEAAFTTSDQIITSLGQEQDVDVVDMQGVLKGAGEYFHDGIHFSPLGSQVVSAAVADAIQRRLELGSAPVNEVAESERPGSWPNN
jgi:lysophospholipase L1-like esterase